MSFSVTLPPFLKVCFFTLTGRMPWRRNVVLTTASLAQRISPRTILPILSLARARAEAGGAWRSVPLEDCEELQLEPIPCEGLVIGLVTVGPTVETLASECLRAGDALGALLFDAAGSAAVEEAADRLGAAIGTDLAGGPAAGGWPAARLSCRVSPGYGRWRLSAQPALFARLPHAALGVELLPSFLMRPSKSISFAMWLGAGQRPLAGLSGCARCELEECRYRRSG